MPSAFAVFAQPHDLEFLAAGTLLLLRHEGWDTHCMSLSCGDCGRRLLDPHQTIERRIKEAMTAAQLLGARFHGSPGKDHQLLYEVEAIRRLAATIREVRPAIILTHSPENCLEDHSNASQLVVSATRVRGLPNFGTHPPSIAADFEVAIYHAMPLALRDGMRRRIFPETYINTTSVHGQKRAALAAHASQIEILTQTHGTADCGSILDEMSREVGRMSGKFEHAEGWRRHFHLGFSPREMDPLADALGAQAFVNPAYRAALDRGDYPHS